MNSFLVSLMFAAGVGAFVWVKLSRRLGSGDPKSAYTTAGLAAVGAFIVFFTILKFMLNLN